MPRATTVVDVMLGEAGGRTPQQRYNDLLHVASTMVNRARLLGETIESVALNNQYNAYGQPLPPGVEAYRSLAEQALTQVLEQGPVTEATFYATPAAVDNLPRGLAYSTETDSHRYFTDPQMRSIYTSGGFRSPIEPELANAPTPEAAPRWETAVPGAVERAELDGVPSGLLGPSVTPAQGYGQLAATMGETPALNLAGAVPASPMDRMSADPVAQGLDGLQSGLMASNMAMGAPDESRFASGPVAQGLDGLQGGLLASNMADMQGRANLINDVNEARGRVTPASAGLLSYDQATPSVSPAAAIEAAAPAQPSAAALADAYGGLGQSLYDGGVLGLSGQKLYDQNSLTEKLVDPTPVGLISAAPAQQTTQAPAQEMGDYTDPQVSVQGPAKSTIQTAGPTPPADVGSFPAAPTTAGQTAKKVAGRVAGALIGGAALGPVGGLMGGLLGNELASGKGLFSRMGSGQPQSVAGLLSSMGSAINNIGQGAQQSYSVWGGGTPTGTQATATDGSRITSLGNGMIARTDRNGVTTTFNDRGNIVGSPVSTGGLFSGIGRDIADAFGGGSSSGGTGGVDTSGMSPGLW